MQNGKICEFNKQQVGSQERKKGSWYGWGTLGVVGVVEEHGHVDFLQSPSRPPQDIWPIAVDSMLRGDFFLFAASSSHILHSLYADDMQVAKIIFNQLRLGLRIHSKASNEQQISQRNQPKSYGPGTERNINLIACGTSFFFSFWFQLIRLQCI